MAVGEVDSSWLSLDEERTGRFESWWQFHSRGQKTTMMTTLRRWCGATCRFIFWTLPLLILLKIQMTLYVLCLLPAFIQFFWFYAVTSDRIVRKYSGTSIRNSLDIYGSTTRTESNNNNSNNSQSNSDDPLISKPVLLYFPGGAWIIGYKMWGALLAQSLVRSHQALVVIPDYRNYPFGTVPDMIQDTEDAIVWCQQNTGESAAMTCTDVELLLTPVLLSYRSVRRRPRSNRAIRTIRRWALAIMSTAWKNHCEAGTRMGPR